MKKIIPNTPVVEIKEEITHRATLKSKEIKEKDDKIAQLSQWVEELKKKVEEGKEIKKELIELRKESENLKNKYNQLRAVVSDILYPEIEGGTLAESDRELINHAKEVVEKLNNLKKNQLNETEKDLLNKISAALAVSNPTVGLKWEEWRKVMNDKFWELREKIGEVERASSSQVPNLPKDFLKSCNCFLKRYAELYGVGCEKSLNKS
jgi:seryl-tRNA synthetase